MKGILISNDFVKDRDGNLRFLEMNTDTVLYGNFLRNDADWVGLTDFLSDPNNGFDTLHLMYKAELHKDAVDDIKLKVAENATNITTVTTQVEALHSSFPTTEEDANNKFILRMCYDENAILDSQYTSKGDSTLKLFNEAGSGSAAIPFYSVDNGGVVTSTLISSSNPSNIPDVVFKPKSNVHGNVIFSKISDWETAKADLYETHYMQNYEINQSSIDSDYVESYRNYGIVYGSGLDYIDLGTMKRVAEFSIPSSSNINWDGLSNWELPIKHQKEFSTSTWKTKEVVDGVFETETFVSASLEGESVGLDEIFIGQELKSFYVPNAPDTDVPDEYLSWFHSGNTWPEGSEVTSSVVVHGQHKTPNLNGEVYKVTTNDETFYLGGSSSAMVYDTNKQVIRYVSVFQLSPSIHKLLDMEGNQVNILSVELLQLEVATGSFFAADIETVDNLLVGTQPLSLSFIVHNRKNDELTPY